jgi:hypothetical protein
LTHQRLADNFRIVKDSTGPFHIESLLSLSQPAAKLSAWVMPDGLAPRECFCYDEGIAPSDMIG